MIYILLKMGKYNETLYTCIMSPKFNKSWPVFLLLKTPLIAREALGHSSMHIAWQLYCWYDLNVSSIAFCIDYLRQFICQRMRQTFTSVSFLQHFIYNLILCWSLLHRFWHPQIVLSFSFCLNLIVAESIWDEFPIVAPVMWEKHKSVLFFHHRSHYTSVCQRIGTGRLNR